MYVCVVHINGLAPEAFHCLLLIRSAIWTDLNQSEKHNIWKLWTHKFNERSFSWHFKLITYFFVFRCCGPPCAASCASPITTVTINVQCSHGVSTTTSPSSTASVDGSDVTQYNCTEPLAFNVAQHQPTSSHDSPVSLHP